MARHGCGMDDLAQERELDQLLSPLCGLMNALEREKFPAWAEEMREDAESGELLNRARKLLGR